jgi:hypothetical protein
LKNRVEDEGVTRGKAMMEKWFGKVNGRFKKERRRGQPITLYFARRNSKSWLCKTWRGKGEV